MVRLVSRLRQWNLVRPPRSFHLLAIDLVRSRPAFGTSQNDHGPLGPRRLALRRASFWMALISATTVSSVSIINWCIASGSEPSTKYGLYPYPLSNCDNSSAGIRANTVGLAIL
jgi:hypothetical protein